MNIFSLYGGGCFMKLMLAKDYNDQDPSGWWMSEKLDGVRAVWTGSVLMSRNGNEFNAPDWFIEELPDGVYLDGELWEGRGMFQKTVGRVRANRGNWGRIKFMVFDVVSEGKCEARQNRLRAVKLPAHCRLVEQFMCKNRQHLDEFESGVLVSGGEGVMLRKPNSAYSHKRSPDLLKVKNVQMGEAVVNGYTDGQGKHIGRIGAIVCEYMGKVFNIGTGISDFLRECPPVVGSSVTFSFIGLTDGGIPRHASLITVRDYE